MNRRHAYRKTMRPLAKSHFLLPFLCLLLAACAHTGGKQMILEGATPLATLPQAAAAAPTSPPSPAAEASPTAAPTQTPFIELTPEPSPTPEPSSTPLPPITLFVPDSWREEAAAAINQLNQTAVSRTWRLVDESEAEARLVNDPSGIIVHESALALAVPLTMDWESVSYDQAQAIIHEGHDSVTLIPWADMEAGQKALRIDGLGPADAGYPLHETWSLIGEPSLGEGLAALAPLMQKAGEDKVIHLAAVGDINLDRSLGAMLAKGDLAYPFADVAEQLRAADITVGNVESALGDTGEPEQKRYPFRAPPEAATALALAGFDLVSLANNHGMDYGKEALMQAIDLLEGQNVATTGAGANSAAARAPKIMELNGLRTAFFGYVNVPAEASTGFDTADWTATEEEPGIAWAEPLIIAEDMTAVRDQVDLIVVQLHSGYEYLPAPSKAQQESARAAIDAGADLVIGHHAHILQGIEQYGDGVIIYGMGNFAFDIDGPPETAIFHIWLDGDGVREVAVEPAIVQFGGQPRLAASWEAPAILSQVYYLTNILNAN